MTGARIVFDLDGTLIDSAPDIRGIANALLSREGLEPLSLAQTHRFIGNGVEVFVQRMRALRGLPDSMQTPLTRDFIAQYQTAHSQTVLYPHVRDALEALCRHHSLGICTNKVVSPCHAVLAHLGIARFFDVVIGGDSLPTRKPNPEMLHAAFDALEGGPRIYIGDSEVDAETALRAEVPFLLYTGGYRKSPVAEIAHSAAFDSHAQMQALIASVLVQSNP